MSRRSRAGGTGATGSHHGQVGHNQSFTGTGSTPFVAKHRKRQAGRTHTGRRI